MKVVLLIASLGTGGAERVMSLLANHWAERGEEVTLITLEDSSRDVYTLHSAVRRVALGLVGDAGSPITGLINNWQRARIIRRHVKASRASVVLSFEDRTNVLAVAATAGLQVRLIVSERTDPTRHHIGRIYSLLRRVAYPMANALIVQTQRLLPWGAAVMFGRRRVHVIPNPVRLLETPVASETIPQPQIVCVGRLGYEKGHDVLLRAFASIAPTCPEWKLVIVGDGPERQTLEALTAELGLDERVVLPGWLYAPENALATASLYVMASRYEGFSNALLEAMSMGLPVISTACGGSEELIAEGSNGLLVPVDDSQALGNAMLTLINDPGRRADLGRQARISARRYTPAQIIPLWDSVLTDTCIPSAAAKSCS